MSNTKITLGGTSLQLLAEVGAGAFATVYKTSIPQFVAKVAFKGNPKALRSYKNELELLQAVQGEGIIELKVAGEA